MEEKNNKSLICEITERRRLIRGQIANKGQSRLEGRTGILIWGSGS